MCRGRQNIWGSCGLNVCVPPNSYVETLTPKCDGVRRHGLGRQLGREGGALTTEVSAVMTQNDPFLLPPCEDAARCRLLTTK